MPINPALLVAADMLQDYLVDKDTGMPLANGVISMYIDTARSFYKNWYYQTGSPGAYTWIPLDNPLHLSSVGTIQDPNGNDVIPFYYPFEENEENVPQKYYVTVDSVDENGEIAIRQFTRENWPPSQVSGNLPTVVAPTLRNYILNNVYWRNIGDLDTTDVLDQVIAASQHDGFTNGDIRFIKNIAGANDAIQFFKMSSQNAVLVDDITPEYGLNYSCNGIQGGETQKCVQYPISLHVDTLQNVSASLVFHGQNVSGNANNYVDLYIYQFAGSGALIQPPPIFLRRVTLNNSWEKLVIPFIFPDAETLVLGEGGDDALFLQVQYPLSLTCNINHTKPQIYLSPEIPDNDFDTYDQIEAIINSPRTGDIRTSLNDFCYFGEVPLNDGTIGNEDSNATSRANVDAWPLFNLIWTKFQTFSNGATNSLAQMVDSAGANIAYGLSAIADFNADRAIYLTQTMGKVILGTVPASLLLEQFSCNFSASNSGGNLLITAINTDSFFQAFNGMPISFTINPGGVLPTGLAANTVYYVSGYNGTNTFFVSTSFANALNSTVIAFTNAGTGINNVIGDGTGMFEGEYAHTQLVAELATHSHTATGGNLFINTGTGGQNYGTGGFTTGTEGATATTGSSTPFNVTQPGVFFNMYMKL